MTTLIRFWPLCLGVLLCVPSAQADPQDSGYDQVNFQVSVESSLANDEMQVTLVSEQQGKTPGGVAGRVNADMKWAQSLVDANKDVQALTTGYQTYPLYEHNAITGWRVTQDLQLTSSSITGLTELIGKLQDRLQVRDIQFHPTRAARDTEENKLIEQGLDAFRQRAALISRHMDNREYRIKDMHIMTESQRPPMPFRAGMAMEAKMAPPPSVEPGTSTVTVTVSGTIQFY